MVIKEEAYTLSMAYLVFKKTYILRIYECLNMTFLLLYSTVSSFLSFENLSPFILKIQEKNLLSMTIYCSPTLSVGDKG